jgi:hypothetical protein
MDLAQTFLDRMEVDTETFVDDIRNTAMACYAAWPERIYVVDRDGRSSTRAGWDRSISSPTSSASSWRTWDTAETLLEASVDEGRSWRRDAHPDQFSLR